MMLNVNNNNDNKMRRKKKQQNKTVNMIIWQTLMFIYEFSYFTNK